MWPYMEFMRSSWKMRKIMRTRSSSGNFWKRKECEQSWTFRRVGGEDNQDDSSSSSEEEDDSHDSKKNTRKRKALDDRAREYAIDALEKYDNVIQNETINTVSSKDSDNETIEQEDNNTNGKNNADERSKRSSSRQAYRPADGAPVKEYLKSLRDKVFKEDLRPTWIPPPYNLVSESFGSSAGPNQFYHVWAYVFDPMSHYCHLMPAKHECIDCKSNNTQYYEWDWKPCHW